MRLVTLACLALAALAGIGTTCITYSQQRGPAGPWVGEVVNLGDQTVAGALGYALITDANGNTYRDGAIACPSKLLPGERGAFEIFYGDEEPIPTPLPTLTPPLSAELSSEAGVGTRQARGEGLLVELVERRPAERLARVRVTNNAEGFITQFSACGIMRAADLTLLEVGRADSPHLPYALFPGESLEMDIYFNSFPADARLQFHALGLLNVPYEECCPLEESTWRSHDAGPFSLLLPPDWHIVPGHGTDSYIGSFVGDRVGLHFDYGGYSDPGPDDDDPAFAVQYETIGGFTAKIYRSQDPGDRMGVYIGGLGHDGPFATRLSLNASDFPPDQANQILQILRSLRFDAFPE